MTKQLSQQDRQPGPDHEAMVELARQAMAKSYSPYSDFKVGAVVVSRNGSVFSACNVENASYPEGTCAEAGAISAMVMAGEQRIQAIYVIGAGDGLVSPCGGCRQRIREFADSTTTVHICGPEGIRKSLLLDQLLPYSFGPQHLNVTQAD
ncbi:cytidine deaminase [Aliidiomarina sedimenti]|nr:cytidine deaminase [Aliidiomarina sedimenti]